jgi:chromosome segregation ATPase
MTDQELQELEAALEWADQIKARISTMTAASRPVTFDEERITVLAAAVRSLRETVKAREEEIARLKSEMSTFTRVLDQALNEGDGSYKP